MDRTSTEARKPAARARAAREKRRRRTEPAQAETAPPATAPSERRREVIASLWRVAEERGRPWRRRDGVVGFAPPRKDAPS
jgi:hypothetical protein